MGFEDEVPSQDDLNKFTALFDKRAQGATFNVVPVNGGPGWDDRNDPGGFANTDIQYATAMAFPTPIIFYRICGISEWENGVALPGDRYLAWFNFVLHDPNVPQTISISFLDYEWSFPPDYIRAVCD